MSVENLNKELEVIHEKIRSESNLEVKMTLMADRDKIMRDLVEARHAEAAYIQQQINDLEEKSRPKTVQMPYSFK